MFSPPKPDPIRQAAWETEELFKQHSAKLMRYLRSGARNSNDLEDLVQETFIRLFKALCNGDSIRNPKAWLFRVGRRLAIDRSRKHQPVLLDEAGWRKAEAGFSYVPEVDAEERSLRSSRLPWKSLSPAERECLLLRAEGFTFREVAELMNVSISSAASYASRAIKKFQRAVAKSSETPEHRRTTPLR